MSQFQIGIDLGTTNCVLAYRPMEGGAAQVLQIPQRMADGSVRSFPSLPSAIYLIGKDEQGALGQGLPWSKLEQQGYIVGKGALELGQRRSGQLVQSAKSWLSHRLVDRREAVLPWGSDIPNKVSPFNATQILLTYLADVWRHSFPDAPMHEQMVALTLPASFDEDARALTLAAANAAGLTNLFLLEEPQAASYHYLANIDNHDQLAQAKMMLVVDIGGGTTDFSLVRIRSTNDGKIALARVAVGDHLLLGGDNLDQALAYQLDPQQIAGLSATRLASVVQQTRQAKELLLSDGGPAQAILTVLGAGSRLIGGSQKFVVERDKLVEQLQSGFLPLCDFSDQVIKSGYAVHTLGLPYEQDAAFTRHLAQFLRTHRSDIEQACDSAVPDLVLFNGGLFNSPLIRSRLIEALNHWRETPVSICGYDAPNEGVALGAVQYLRALQGDSLRIESGAPHHLLLQVDEDKFVTLLAKGTLTGADVTLEQRFVAKIGDSVQFPLYRADDAFQLASGDLVTNEPDRIHYVSKLITELDGGHGENLEVSLSACLTEVGVLRVSIRSGDGRQWELHFAAQTTGKASVDESQSSLALHKNIGQAEELLAHCFTAAGQKADPDLIKSLRGKLESLLGPRESWNLPTLRRLGDKFLALKSGRGKSAAHERNWLQLIGFCLRPGYGAEGDEQRIQALINATQNGVKFDEAAVWSQYWTCYRRVAGGLDVARQQHLYQQFAKYFSPAGQRSRALQSELPKRAADDLIRLVGALERLPESTKLECSDWLIKRLAKSSEPDTGWWTVGRLFSRRLLLSDVQVASQERALKMVQKALQEDWRKRKQAGLAAVLMVQPNDDEPSEIVALRNKVSAKLTKEKCPDAWLERLQPSGEFDDEGLSQLLGESLPIGLQLV
ncbi:heat-shock protein Hsp70 [Maribrevibacterium harenarium]|uniref:Heat-shock protein Hsp70 n=1 Tax=Maribrevibacterium harenarium TaxID=2589817 RepID=A0A501X573_9GAMM|nr:hsp70 family protein [Maribrevibacterium harenarium]TPE55589.1 heat-shock protein Hsp70 [Maribrevibacterium harenarium]